MTRQKKTRKAPVQGPKRKPLQKKAENEKLSKKKGKGQATGGRHNVSTLQSSDSKLSQAALDRRHGSKKPVALGLEPTVNVKKKKVVQAVPQPEQAPASIAAVRPVSVDPEQALEALESDPRLEALLERLDKGEKLPSAEQTWLDNSLAKIEVLMTELGYDLGDDSEDDLLERFENGSSLDNYKQD